MSIIFGDTSALAKRYLPEAGSGWMRRIAVSSLLVIAELATVEMFSLLNRQCREGTITNEMKVAIQRVFLRHVETEYMVILSDASVHNHARALVDRHPLRTLDALQLASALRARAKLNAPLDFISADRNLLTAAAAEGFNVDNPNAHV